MTAITKAGGVTTLVPVDLADLDGLARLGAALNERYGKLDVLVGNAGVLGPASPLGHIEPKQWTDVDDNKRHRELPADPLHGAAAGATPTPAARCSSRQVPRATRAPISAPTRPPRPRWNPGADLGAGNRDHQHPRHLFNPGRSAPACARR